MSVASHLGIRIGEYDARIRTFIPWYEEILDAAAASIQTLAPPAPAIVDLGTGSGALAARCLAVSPRARITGLDADAAMLALARRRDEFKGGGLSTVRGDFLRTPIPRCDAITASFSLHHVRTRRAKAALYARCFRALRPGGVFVHADCCPASHPRLAARGRETWREHLRRAYTPRRTDGFLRAWSKEDVHVPLDVECDLLASAGFDVDVTWRRGSFAVIAGTKPGRARA